MDDDKNRDPSSSDPLSEHTAHPEDADFAAWQRFTAEHPSETPPRQRRRLDALGVAAIAILVMTVLGVIALRPTGPVGSTTDASSIGIPTDLHAADIVSVELVDCLNRGEATCESVAFELVEGPDVGAVYTQVFPPSAVNPDFDVGRTAVLARANTNGTVIDIGEVPCPADPSVTCPVITVAVDDVAGPLEYIVGSGEIPPLLEAGDGVIVELFPDSDPPQVLTVYPVDVDLVYQFNGDFERRSLLLWTTILFVVAVVAVGLLRGVAAIGGLVVSVGILLLFVLPAILDGRSPVLVAIVGASAIAIVSLYLSHGFTRLTNVALIGMVVALVLTAVLSAVAVELADFSGFASEESTLLTLFDGIDVRGLLLAGIVLGTAGALDDVTVTQASAVWQLSSASPDSDRRTLFTRAMHIGRDHIASTVNTLLLAYAGAALPLLVLFVLSEQSLGAIANSEIVAVEIIRTLVGSIGLVAAVPITTWLAAGAVHRRSVDQAPHPD